jgi:multiple sugar transport system substrate-binding protein
MRQFRGVTWDHPRGRNALEASADQARRLGGVDIRWDAHSLEHFESHPIDELAREYDLIVLDHPHLGEALALGSLQPIDEVIGEDAAQRLVADAVGRSGESYVLDGRLWALPLDAATQVAAYGRGLEETATTWDDMVALSARADVALSVAGPHAFLSFSSVCASLGAVIGGGPDALVDREVAIAALEPMREIAARAPQWTTALNPIGLLDAMAAGERLDAIPLVYGYVNYSGDAVRFADAPAWTLGGLPGSTIGGTGIAVSRRCDVDDALVAHLLHLVDDEVQRRFIPLRDGQPALDSAWTDPLLDAAAFGFYSATIATMRAGIVRPRHDGYIAFQSLGSEIIRGILSGDTTEAAGLDRLDEAYRSSLAAARTPITRSASR